MSLSVISDFHIYGSDDPLYQVLLKILRENVSSGDTLVIGGDLFDIFIGNKKVFLNRYSEFFQEIASVVKKGVSVHYIEGNHDFFLKRAFKIAPGVQIHPHDVSVELNGKKFLFIHGDTVDRTDFGYLLLRAFLRSPFLRAFVTLAPSSWIDWIGRTSSKRSRGKKPLLPSGLPANKVERLRKIYRSYAAECLAKNYDFVVMGHCHDLDEMFFNLGGRRGQYINIGYPRVHGSYLTWNSGDEKIQREKLPED